MCTSLILLARSYTTVIILFLFALYTVYVSLIELSMVNTALILATDVAVDMFDCTFSLFGVVSLPLPTWPTRQMALERPKFVTPTKKQYHILTRPLVLET